MRRYGRTHRKLTRRNKQGFWYANVEGKTEIIDDNGDPTGEYEITYSEPEYAEGVISASAGMTVFDTFGIVADYSRMIYVELPFHITEESVVWLDGKNPDNGDGHNYIVSRIGEPLDYYFFGVKEVK
jgi:hypothetical protein